MSSGTLALTVIEARLTRDTETFGKMDPYVKISSRQQQFKTNVKNGAGKTPVWNQTFNIEVKYIGDDLNLEVFDEDVGSDDKIGEASFKLSALCANNGIDEWFTIAFRGKQSGQVHLKSVFKPVGGAAKAGGAAAQPQMMQQPGMMMQPGMQQPMMQQQPMMMQPGMQQPMMQQPGMMMQPGMQQPMMQPGMQ